MAGYNRTRYVEQLLEKTESSPPSFTVHLYPEYWVLNNGSKFLYHNQIASLLDDIRAHRIPVDFLHLFDQARVPFYEGCMVVELLDYRPQKSKEPALKTPEKTRVILHPNAETLYEDICSLNTQNGSKWTDQDALEVEAKLLLVTSQPLCLDPDPHLTRIVNHVIRVSTPSMPMSLKRKASVMEPEEDGPEKAKRDRLMGFMAPRGLKPHPEYDCPFHRSESISSDIIITVINYWILCIKHVRRKPPNRLLPRQIANFLSPTKTERRHNPYLPPLPPKLRLHLLQLRPLFLQLPLPQKAWTRKLGSRRVKHHNLLSASLFQDPTDLKHLFPFLLNQHNINSSTRILRLHLPVIL
ncbi:Spt20 family-domain-containing protein [Panaeolus papilionaceus]|nr:Spt20 family-domain-containing protein [Panaeolus papilionaceus]